MKTYLLVALCSISCMLFGSAPLPKEAHQSKLLPKAYQVIVIGGGGSGLVCAQKCTEDGFSTLVIDAPVELPIHTLFPVQNWPDSKKSTWIDILDKKRQDFEKSSGVFLARKALSITKNRGRFCIRTEKETFDGIVCVIATGKKFIPPPGQIGTQEPSHIILRLYNTDVFQSKDTVSIIGDDEQTLKSAIAVAQKVSKVFLFFPARANFSRELFESLSKYPNVSFVQVDRIIKTSNRRDACVVEYNRARSKYIQESSWVIFGNLWPPQSAIARYIVPCDSEGAVITYDSSGSTNSPGLFACGEVASTDFLSGLAAVSSGMSTGMNVCQYLREKGIQASVRPPPQTEQTSPTGPAHGPTGEKGPVEEKTKAELPHQ